MSIRPLEDRILIKPTEPETKTASGLFLPESAKERPMQGTVVATGPGLLPDTAPRAEFGSGVDLPTTRETEHRRAAHGSSRHLRSHHS